MTYVLAILIRFCVSKPRVKGNLNEMGKHKSQEQIIIMLNFMERNAELARGFMKGDRVEVELKWKELGDSLNSVGPPTKTAEGWKKVWADWKSEVKKKIARKKKETTATGPFNKVQLSATEETVAKISGMSSAVECIHGAFSFGIEKKPIEKIELSESEDDDNKSDTSVQSRANIEGPPTPKRKREDSLQESVITYLNLDDSTLHEKLLHNLENIVDAQKESSVDNKRLYRAVYRVSESVDKMRRDMREHFKTMEKALMERNSLKRRQIEIEELKLQLEMKNSKEANNFNISLN